MNMPPINPSKAQLKNSSIVSNHFEDIHRASRNKERKHDQEENMLNNQNIILKIEELKIRESFEDSSRDASPNRYADDTENERDIKIKLQPTMIDSLKPTKLSIYHTSALIMKNKPEFVTHPHSKKVNNNPYVSSHEISQSDSKSKNQVDNIQFDTDVCGIKYIEMILRDKSLDKSA